MAAAPPRPASAEHPRSTRRYNSTQPHDLLGRSPAFCFGSAKNDTRCDLIQFVSSLGWAPRDGDGPRDVLIGFGVNDCGNRIARLPLRFVLAYATSAGLADTLASVESADAWTPPKPAAPRLVVPRLLVQTHHHATYGAVPEPLKTLMARLRQDNPAWTHAYPRPSGDGVTTRAGRGPAAGVPRGYSEGESTSRSPSSGVVRPRPAPVGTSIRPSAATSYKATRRGASRAPTTCSTSATGPRARTCFATSTCTVAARIYAADESRRRRGCDVDVP